jgi:hypothetical protein
VKHQFCVKQESGQHCSDANAIPVELDEEDWKGASPVQIAALKLLIEANRVMPISGVGEVRTSKATGDGIVTSHITPDQWVKEVEGLDSFVWASLQALVTDYAIGPGVRNAELAEFVLKPENLGDKQLCETQKMRKAGGFV